MVNLYAQKLGSGTYTSECFPKCDMLDPWFKAQLTQQQRLLGKCDFCKQSVMPPHDIVSNLYEHPEIFFPIFTGEPGRLEKYWVENQDLYKSLGMGSSETWHFEVCFLFGFFKYVYIYIYQFRFLGHIYVFKYASLFSFIGILCENVFAYVLTDPQPVCNQHLRIYLLVSRWGYTGMERTHRSTLRCSLFCLFFQPAPQRWTADC